MMINDQRKMALISGFSLVAMAILAGFAYGYVFNGIYVANDGPATILNLNKSELLFRFFIFLFLMILILDVIVAWALYGFFKQVDKSLSMLSAWFRIVYCAIFGASFLNLLSVLPFINNASQSEVFVMSSLKGFLDMWSLGLIVLSFHLFLLGYLMLKAGFIPNILGFLTLFAANCYLLSNMANLLLPTYEVYKGTVDMVLSLPMALGELGLAIWLLVKRGKIRVLLFGFKNSLSNSA